MRAFESIASLGLLVGALIFRFEAQSFAQTDGCASCDAGLHDELAQFQSTYPRYQTTGFRSWADGLCFDYQGVIAAEPKSASCQSDGHDFRNVAGLLGPVAAAHGACDGHSTVIASAFQNVQFHCDGSRAEEGAAISELNQAVGLRGQGCRRRVDIHGFCNLRELCLAYPDAVRRLVVETNVMQTIAHFNHVTTDSGMSATALQSENARAISRFYYDLEKRHRTPLMFEAGVGGGGYGHVLLVVGLGLRRLTDAERANPAAHGASFLAELRLNDSEFPTAISTRNFYLNTGMTQAWWRGNDPATTRALMRPLEDPVDGHLCEGERPAKVMISPNI